MDGTAGGTVGGTVGGAAGGAVGGAAGGAVGGHQDEIWPGSSLEWGRVELAAAIGLAHSLPLMPINWLQEAKCWYGVGGAARKTLQVDIMRKYLQFTDSARKRVGAAGFVEALYRDAVEVVDHGYMQLLAGAAALGKIIAILLFTAFHSPQGVPLQLLLPLFMLVRLRSAEQTATTLRLKYFRAQNRMLSHAETATNNYQLIRDFQRRPEMASRMQRLVDDVNVRRLRVTTVCWRANSSVGACLARCGALPSSVGAPAHALLALCRARAEICTRATCFLRSASAASSATKAGALRNR